MRSSQRPGGLPGAAELERRSGADFWVAVRYNFRLTGNEEGEDPLGGRSSQLEESTLTIPRSYAAALGTALLTVALAAPALAQDPQIEVLAEGLNNPRGVKVAADGVYVVEAGVGGDDLPR